MGIILGFWFGEYLEMDKESLKKEEEWNGIYLRMTMKNIIQLLLITILYVQWI